MEVLNEKIKALFINNNENYIINFCLMIDNNNFIHISIQEYNVPVFSKNEQNLYLKQKNKALYDTPYKEFLEYSRKNTKKCSKCNKITFLYNFSGNTSGTDAFNKTGYRLRRPECKICTKEQNIGKRQAILLAKNNGISYKAPDGTKCEICNNVSSIGNSIVFDHCHKTNSFRGYCCNSCNRSIGVLGDNIEGMIKVINYLNKNQQFKIKQDINNGLLYIEKINNTFFY